MHYKQELCELCTRPSRLVATALSLDGLRLYVSNRPIGTVSVLNIGDGAIRSVITAESSPTKVLTHLIPRD